jgi:YkoY family integral membrane protein
LDIHASDFVTIGLLVVLEGLLSADNAIVLAILVLGLPGRLRKKALRYGIVGAFVFRIAAILTAAHMMRLGFVKLFGAIYLLYLAYGHFFGSADAGERRKIKAAKPWMGLSAFWATVVKVELTDIVFAVDSIVVAVAMSPKVWVVITGGILGVVAMRLVIGQFVAVVQRYPALVDGAFVIIAWVGIKLILEYAHGLHWIQFEIPTWFSLGLIVVIFSAAFLVARRIERRAGPHTHPLEDKAAALLAEDDPNQRGR